MVKVSSIILNAIIMVGFWYMYFILKTQNVVYFLFGMYWLQIWVDNLIEKYKKGSSEDMVINESVIEIQSKEDVKKVILALKNVDEKSILEPIIDMFALATKLDSEVINMAFGNVLEEFYGTAMSIENGSKIIFNTLEDKLLDEDMGDRGLEHNGFYALKSILENHEEITNNADKIEELECIRDCKQNEIEHIDNELVKLKKEQVRLLSGE